MRLPGVGSEPGPLDLIYFLIFTTLPLSHSGFPGKQTLYETSFQEIHLYVHMYLPYLVGM
jgi:hypothetical protein